MALDMDAVLTPEDITNLLANTRQRGGHEAYVRKFIAEGAMYWTVNYDQSYKGKTPAQLDTSVKQGLLAACKKIDNCPTIKVIMNGDDLLIINTDKVAANLAPSDSTEDEE